MSTDRPRKALIPAAGRGTRFLPLTKAVPKELAPIVTTPTLEIVIGEAADNDISEVLLVVSAGKTASTSTSHHGSSESRRWRRSGSGRPCSRSTC